MNELISAILHSAIRATNALVGDHPAALESELALRFPYREDFDSVLLQIGNAWILNPLEEERGGLPLQHVRGKYVYARDW